ncbi:TlpA family protein disulfide reductase [Sphingobacterium puteale]|uniref:TlpA family protein disulfide reductase n=1 Tax=Sphingobacterium puteale TaxID=2420510 RepID=A0A420VX10_9SPHI|nr:TlpA disulfide reductase family protein [Sphingobacterium puteale]RKO70767.1 TlpA family protein disulfide reductase [Sphingobacterium puteale]
MNIFFRAGELLPNFRIQFIYSALLSVLCFSMFSLSAQTPRRDSGAGGLKAITALKIGDTIPEALWNTPLQVVNHPSGKEQITLNYYRDKKLIILDFWATWCGPCLKSFPKLDSLQADFKDDLAILLVNSRGSRDTPQRIKNVLSKRVNPVQMPSIINDTILIKLFPPQSLTHSVWIRDSKVFGLTLSDKITKNSLAGAIAGMSDSISQNAGATALPEKNQLSSAPSEDNSSYIYRSFLRGYNEQLTRRSIVIQDSSGNVNRIVFTNSPILDFYKLAYYPTLASYGPARTILHVKDPDRLHVPNDLTSAKAWMEQHTFNYLATFPARSNGEAVKLFTADIDRYFGYRVEFAEREIGCWIITTNDPRKITGFPADLPRETNLSDNTGLPLFVQNYPFSSLVGQLERMHEEPFIDETQISKPVSMDLPADLMDMAKLKRSFERQGLRLRKESRKIKVAIITDPKTTN